MNDGTVRRVLSMQRLGYNCDVGIVSTTADRGSSDVATTTSLATRNSKILPCASRKLYDQVLD